MDNGLLDNIKLRLEKESLDAFEIYYSQNKRLCVESAQAKIESIINSDQDGIAIRAIKNNKLGFISSTGLCLDDIDKAIVALVDSVELVSESKENILPKIDELKLVPKSDMLFDSKRGRSLDEIDNKEKIEKACVLEDLAKSVDKRITAVRQPLYEELIKKVIIYNSSGIQKSYKRGICSCEIRAIASENGKSESGWDFNFSPYFDELNFEKVAISAAKKSLALLGAGPVKTAKYNVVFSQRACSQFIKLIAPSFFSNNIQHGKSFLVGKKGEGFYSDLITIIDDGMMLDGYNSFIFDDEGIPRQQNYLVKNGIVVDWLYDTLRATSEGRISTGNSSRKSINQMPVVDVSNCYLKSGKTEVEELYKEAGNGILITDMMGLHTANIITGEFSLGAEGFKIFGGVISQPVRGIIVSGNVHDLFRNIVKVGKNLKFYGNYGAPSVLATDILISGNG